MTNESYSLDENIVFLRHSLSRSIYILLHLTWGSDKRCIPVLHQDDDGDQGEEDAQGGDADGKDGEDGAVRHVLDLESGESYNIVLEEIFL